MNGAMTYHRAQVRQLHRGDVIPERTDPPARLEKSSETLGHRLFIASSAMSRRLEPI